PRLVAAARPPRRPRRGPRAPQLLLHRRRPVHRRRRRPGPGARRAHPPLAHQLLPEVRMSYPWWATALIAAGTFLAGVKIGRIERAEERALDEADDLAGLAAAVGYNLEADDHPTPAPATVACR